MKKLAIVFFCMTLILIGFNNCAPQKSGSLLSSESAESLKTVACSESSGGLRTGSDVCYESTGMCCNLETNEWRAQQSSGQTCGVGQGSDIWVAPWGVN